MLIGELGSDKRSPSVLEKDRTCVADACRVKTVKLGLSATEPSSSCWLLRRLAVKGKICPFRSKTARVRGGSLERFVTARRLDNSVLSKWVAEVCCHTVSCCGS